MKRRILAAVLALLWAPLAAAGVNVNTAGQKELESLPGIGPSKATAIIEYRNANGPFASCAKLDDVPGIGPATLANITPMCEVGDGQTAAPADSSGGAPAASSGGGGSRVNVNTASASELTRLPGIGASKAAAIVQYRTDNGPFGSCSDLQRVTGVGAATVAAIADQCTTGE
jgi:competence protein ComEA